MTDDHIFMLFGACVAALGAILAAYARSGRGKTIVRVLGFELSVEAAGGILVILIGSAIFSMPYIINRRYPAKQDQAVLSLTKKDLEATKLSLSVAEKTTAKLSSLINHPGIASLRYAYPKDKESEDLCQARLLGAVQDTTFPLRNAPMSSVSFSIGTSAVLIQCEPWNKRISVTIVVFGETKQDRINQLSEAANKAERIMTESFGEHLAGA